MRGRTNTGEGVALGIDFRFRKFDVMNYLRYYLVFTFALLYITNSCSIYDVCQIPLLYKNHLYKATRKPQ